jgi:hypothetical protein
MGAMPESLPDCGAMFWPVLSLGALIGVMGGLLLSFILSAIFRGNS